MRRSSAISIYSDVSNDIHVSDPPLIRVANSQLTIKESLCWVEDTTIARAAMAADKEDISSSAIFKARLCLLIISTRDPPISLSSSPTSADVINDCTLDVIAEVTLQHR